MIDRLCRSRALLLALPLAAFCATATAQGADGFQLTASFERAGLPTPKWQMQIAPSGRVTYSAEHGTGVHVLSEGPTVFTLTRAGAGKLHRLLDDSNGLQPCETKTKNLARMGMKTVEYQSGSQPAARCTFNYTDNKPLASAAEMLLAISFTVEQGAMLDWQHRYDRLGLDTSMTQLVSAAKEGRALELQAIRPTLQSLVADEAVLDRVRQKAAALLSTLEPVGSPTATALR